MWRSPQEAYSPVCLVSAGKLGAIMIFKIILVFVEKSIVNGRTHLETKQKRNLSQYLQYLI